MDQGKRLFINSISSIFSLVVQVGIGVFLVPYILHHLTKEVYGIWALTGSLLGYSALLSLGLNSAVNRYIPKYLVENNWEGMNRVVNTTLFFYLAGGILVLIATFYIVFNFVEWFHIPEEYHIVSMWAVAISGIGWSILVPLQVFSAVLTGLQRYELQSLSNISSKLSRIGAIVILFRNGFGFIALSIVTVLANIINRVLIAIFAIRGCKNLKFHWRFFSWSTFREMFAYSINSLLYATGGIIQLQAAKVLIGWMIGASFVTEYELPSFLLMQLASIVMAGTKVMKPAASSLEAQNKIGQLQVMYILGVKYAFMIVIPNAILFLLYGKAIMTLWIGEVPFIVTSLQVLTILVIPEMFRLGHTGAYFIVVGLGKHRPFGIATLANGITSIIFSYIIEKNFHLGVISIAIGFAIPNFITSVFIIPLYCAKVVKLKFRSVISHTIYPAILSSIPFCIYLSGLKYIFMPSTIAQLIGLVGGGGIILFISWWLIGFKAEEKARFIKYIPLKKIKSRVSSS